MSPWRNALVRGWNPLAGGEFELSDAPGLGLELDDASDRRASVRAECVSQPVGHRLARRFHAVSDLSDFVRPTDWRHVGLERTSHGVFRIAFTGDFLERGRTMRVHD